ncbi:MAG: hypothetical protein QOH10_40 [Actinomycetota bacterium]|jgi:uncharacterized alpha-E superfamily protein|nr:hypothetical protein [Actinomycetota bacterium]
MLSRIAESLYWVGRYCERAEDTARLLDVYYHLLLEERGIDEIAASRGILEVMGVAAELLPDEPDAVTVTDLLAWDLSYTGSISSSLRGAWENARGAREAISSEMWETLNTTYRAIAPGSVRATGPTQHRFFASVRDRAATLAGLADSTLSRDDGWQFLALGRNVERADMTTRLLSAHCGESLGPSRWTTLLRSCSGYEAYLRTYHRAVDASSAVEFLVLDRMFPRSVFYALSAAETCLVELDPRASRAANHAEARRLLGRKCSELAYLRVDDLLADLGRQIDGLQDTCVRVHAAVADRYFPEAYTIEWSV